MSSFPVNIAVSPTMLRLGSGQQGELQVTITNVSDVVEHYDVTVVGLPSQEYWRCEGDVTKLRPGETGTVRVTVMLPPRGGLGGGTYALAVLVRSPYQPAVSRAADVALTVEAVSGVTLSAQPTIAQGTTEANYGLLARNDGNVAMPLQIVAMDDQGRARFQIDPPTLYLNPGDTQLVRVHVTAPGRLTGQERRSAIVIRALDGHDQVAETQVNFIQPPRIPAAVTRTLGILLAVAIVAGAILVGAWLTRDKTPAGGGTAGPSTPPVMTSSAQGQDPPKIAEITVDPAEPVAGDEVQFAATADGKVDSWAWKVTGPDGNVVTTSDQQGGFSVTLADAGDYQVELAAASQAGGATTVSRKVTVGEPAPVYLQQVTTFPSLQPGDTQNVEVTCPDGMVAVSGGVRIPPENNLAISLAGSGPSGNGWSVLATANSTVNDLDAVVVCVKAPLGYSVRSQSENVAAGDVVQLTAKCDSGQVAWGGGGLFGQGAPNGVRLVETRPADVAGDQGRGWTATGVNDTGQDVEFTVTAVCGETPQDWSLETQSFPNSSNPDLDTTAQCQGDSRVLGGGVGVSEPESGSVDTATVLRLSGPVVAGGSDAWRGAIVLPTGAPDMTVFAVCGVVAAN